MRREKIFPGQSNSTKSASSLSHFQCARVCGGSWREVWRAYALRRSKSLPGGSDCLRVQTLVTMSRRAPGSFDPDDKYAKANSQNGNRSHATPPPNKSRPISDPHRFASQVASPAQAQGTDNNDIAARVRSKLDAAAASLNDDQPSGSDLVKGSLDRLAFASTVNNVASAFGSVGNDALDEVGTLASKATEQVALFHASQYAAKWMPVDSKLGMKPTYVKVHVQSAEVSISNSPHSASLIAHTRIRRDYYLCPLP